MSTFEHVSSPGVVARVSAATTEGNTLYLEFRDGKTATVSGPGCLGFKVGSVVLVWPDEDRIEAAPQELWPENSWVGVIRLRLPDVTVVDSSGRWRLLQTSDVACVEGNTVEVRDSYGVVRVLSNEPIRYTDLPAVDSDAIDRFRSRASMGKETFEDFGGLNDVVDRARELIEIPLKNRASFLDTRARHIKGVLFSGPPGTGKTMLARIIANSTAASFYEISGPEIFSKWYGQSEEILRRLFEDAAKQEQAIIFFDEIDSVAGQRGDDTHEASRRVVAQLLTLMDGFAQKGNVIVIAATNRPQDIDAALRRPGRFDWEIQFHLPDKSDRERILKSWERRLSVHGEFPHEWLSSNTVEWSPAELAAIWTEAALLAVADGRSVIVAEDYVGGYERVSAHRRCIV